MKSLHGGQRINERETKNYGRPSPADAPYRRDCFFGSLFRGTDNPAKMADDLFGEPRDRSQSTGRPPKSRLLHRACRRISRTEYDHRNNEVPGRS